MAKYFLTYKAVEDLSEMGVHMRNVVGKPGRQIL
jgi:hypothetical protein